MMGSHDVSTEPKVHEDGEKPAMLELHVQQVEDRALPATEVLMQQARAREADARSPIFVP